MLGLDLLHTFFAPRCGYGNAFQGDCLVGQGYIQTERILNSARERLGYRAIAYGAEQNCGGILYRKQGKAVPTFQIGSATDRFSR